MNADKEFLFLSAFIGGQNFFSSAPGLSFDRSSSMKGLGKSGSFAFLAASQDVRVSTRQAEARATIWPGA